MLLPNRTAYSRTFLIFFFHSSVLAFHCIVSLLVDGHSCSTCFHLIAEWYAAPRMSFSVRWPWRAQSERWTVGHPPFRICHWIVLIPTYSLMTFPGEASTITFSVAKLVQAVFCKYQVPYSSNFFKNFLPSAGHPIKTFQAQGWNNSVIPCIPILPLPTLKAT